jgi:hypothetical protein
LELQRLQQLKQDRLGEIISELRQQILALWHLMEYDEVSREYFDASLQRQDFDEDLLAEHEAELERLEVRCSARKTLLKV